MASSRPMRPPAARGRTARHQHTEHGRAKRGRPLQALASPYIRGRVLSREHLLNRVWGYDYLGDSRLVDVAITADGKATLHGLIQFPSTFDPGRKYPAHRPRRLNVLPHF